MAVSSANAMSASKSTESQSPATGFLAPGPMEVDDGPGSNGRAVIASSPSALTSAKEHASAAASPAFVEQELISPTSRLSRLPTKVPSPAEPNTSRSPRVAIPAYQNPTNNYTSQDVHVFVNGSASSSTSPATRTFAQPPTPLETSVSSFPQPITQHGLTHPIRRPRTSTVFSSSSDLAAHYGIPQRLPPAPQTTSRYKQPAPKESPAVVDFQTLSANYLNMLSQKSTDNSMAAPSTTTPAPAAAVNPSQLDAAASETLTQQQLQDIATMLATSPEFRDNDEYEKYIATPMPGLDDDFGVSPHETPYADFLTTPLFPDIDEPMLTSPYMTDLPLFADMSEYTNEVDEPVVQDKPPFNLDSLYTISPETPLLHSFDPSTTFPPRASSVTSTAPSNAGDRSATPGSRRASKATGMRKGVKPENLLDEDAPTQPRKYTTPSATSKKEVPAVFARKRARSTAFGDEEDQLGDDLPLNPTEKDLIEQKRRQNTVAARRSRKRKLEQFQMLEKSRDEERRLKEVWQDRAQMLLDVLHGLGHAYPEFPPDQPQYSDA